MLETPVKGKEYREIRQDGDYVLNLHYGQSQAWLSKARFPVLLTGRQCIAGDSVIDNPFGKSKTIKELSHEKKPVFVWALDDGSLVPAIGSVPFRKGKAPLYRLVTESGREIKVTLGHRLLTSQNCHQGFWVSLRHILTTFHGGKDVYVAYGQPPEYVPYLPVSSWEYDQSIQTSNVLNFAQRESSSLVNCCCDSRPYDERPLVWSNIDQEYFPLQVDVAERNCHERSGVRAYTVQHNRPYQSESHLPIRGSEGRASLRMSGGYQVLSSFHGQSQGHDSKSSQYALSSSPVSLIPLSSQSHRRKPCVSSLSNLHLDTQLSYDKWDRIVKLEYQLTDDYYDIQVPNFNNYLANGLIHHNSGKTIFEPDWLYREIQEKGEGDYLVGSATFPLMDKKLLPEMESLFCRILKWGTYRDSDKMIISKNEKSKIFFFTGVNPEAIESATAKGAVLDEVGQKQFRLGTWEAVQGRLAIHQGRALLCTTPYDFGWLKTQIYDKWRAGDKTFDVISFESVENPAFPREEFERLRKVLAAWKFEMFYRGRFTKPAGLVYDVFDSSVDVIDRFPIPMDWPIYVGHDFGMANPAALFYAMNPMGELFAFHEYLPGRGRSVYDHVEQFKIITKDRHVVSRKGGNWTTEEEIRQAYTAQGWAIGKPKWKEVNTQIEKVYGLNALHKVKIFRDLTHYIDQKMSFSYELDDTSFEPTDKYDSESGYHLLAAERYICSDFTPETVDKEPQSAIVQDLRPSSQEGPAGLFAKVQSFKGSK